MAEYIKCKTEMNFQEFVEFVSEELQRNGSEFKGLGLSLTERNGLYYGDGQYYRFDNGEITMDLVRNEGYADLFDTHWIFGLNLKLNRIR